MPKRRGGGIGSSLRGAGGGMRGGKKGGGDGSSLMGPAGQGGRKKGGKKGRGGGSAGAGGAGGAVGGVAESDILGGFKYEASDGQTYYGQEAMDKYEEDHPGEGGPHDGITGESGMYWGEGSYHPSTGGDQDGAGADDRWGAGAMPAWGR
jgi:hypothetical protein